MFPLHGWVWSSMLSAVK